MRKDRYNRKATPDKYFRLIEYARDKIDERDWHGLADAGMDLREMEAANPKLAEMERPKR